MTPLTSPRQGYPAYMAKRVGSDADEKGSSMSANHQQHLSELRRTHAAVQATEEMYRAASRRRAEAVVRAVDDGFGIRAIARALGIKHQTVSGLYDQGVKRLEEAS